VTVDRYGTGLVVLASRPEGGGQAVITTYGLSEGELEALRERWAAAA
jgi:hypothetical protein